jgi:hypothetical protein
VDKALSIAILHTKATTRHHTSDVVVGADQAAGPAFDAVLVGHSNVVPSPLVHIGWADGCARLINAAQADIVGHDVNVRAIVMFEFQQE